MIRVDSPRSNRKARWFALILINLLTIFLMNTARAQTEDTVTSLPGITIETSVNRAEMYVGDLIEYVVSITFDSSYRLEPPPLGANLGSFDVKDYQPDIESELPDGRINSKTIFTLSTFTTGDYIIPPVPVSFMLPDSSRRIMLAEPVPISVLSLLLDSDDTADIRPAKAPYEFPKDYSLYYWWGGGALLLLALALFLWLRRRKKSEKEEFIDNRDPWEIAFERLAMLKESDLLTQGSFKEYYFELTEIVRAYLGRLYKVDVLEMTTEEFLEVFATIELPHTVYNDASAFLGHADLVKFAKLLPGLERAENDLIIAHGIVETVREDYERKQEYEITMSNQRERPLQGEEKTA